MIGRLEALDLDAGRLIQGTPPLSLMEKGCGFYSSYGDDNKPRNSMY